MAFFTRPNISVPILPPTENASSLLETNEFAVTKTIDCTENERYEFTIETFGVQV